MNNNYTKPAVRKNIFVSTLISYKSIIDFDSIEDMWDNLTSYDLGSHFFEYDIDKDVLEKLKEIVSKKYTLSKSEIKRFDWENATRKVLAYTYRDMYESELYDELFNHIENELASISQYHFEGSKSIDSVHFSEGEYIRVGMTKKEFEIAFENDIQYYDTKEDFFDNAETTFENYIEELYSKYSLEHFDYYGSRICIYNEWQKNIFEAIDWELYELLNKRKSKYNQIKNWIKNKVPFQYRTIAIA